jgi:hypothetical protein
MLLSDWSSDSAKDIIERNRSHRLKQRVQKRVRFIMPSIALDVVGPNWRTRSISIDPTSAYPSLSSSSSSSSFSSSSNIFGVLKDSSSPLRKGDEDAVNSGAKTIQVEAEKEGGNGEQEGEKERGKVYQSDQFDVGGWLNSIHLGRYTDVFVQFGFDNIEHVQSLTSSDLDAMGIKVPRHRALLLKESSALI